MKLHCIQNDRVYIDNIPMPIPSCYHKLKYDSTAIMLVGFDRCFISYYLWDRLSTDRGFNLTLPIKINSRIVEQKWCGLIHSNAQSLSSCLRRNDWFPNEYMSVYTREGYVAAEVETVKVLLDKHGYTLTKNLLGTYVPVRCLGAAANKE